MSQKALLVGINKYKIPGSDLNGCVNDVTNIRDCLLKYFGFTIKDIRVLTDERATKKGILSRLEWLIAKAKTGDKLLFNYSGCRDNQTSADAYIKGNYNGAFTYYFCKHLREVQGNITRSELLKRLRSSLKHNGYRQIPQLEAPKEEKGKKVLG